MSEYLSNIELYFTEPKNISDNYLIIDGSDVKHIQKVMRHKTGDILFVTDGKGKIYEGEIVETGNDKVKIKVTGIRRYTERFKNITVCMPNLKKSDRLEFALEKATELGVTNFIVFNCKRTIAKKVKIERLNKIILSAMKQSLNSYLPNITFYPSLSFLKDTDSQIILFDQNKANEFKGSALNADKDYYFLFGPEGGFEEGEIPSDMTTYSFKLAANRLRTETAVVCAVSKLST